MRATPSRRRKPLPRLPRKKRLRKPQSPKRRSPLPRRADAPTAAAEPARASNAAYVSTERPLGLRYSVVQVANGGTESEVSPTAMFHAGDMVRVKVEGNRDGYLYVILRGSSGNWKPLFPAADINDGENRIGPHRGYRLPSDTQAFTFDEQAGQEQLFVIYSPEPVKDMDALIPSLGSAEKAPADKLKPGPMIMASAHRSTTISCHASATATRAI